ncbi:MAG: hypothetical protein GC138_07240 [Gammaproteobacteria bacterium]|nr:hypothetical protein [Gammaproteobacteria bacterium]
MRELFENLSASERTLVIVASAVLLSGLVYGLAWRPLQGNVAEQNKKIAQNEKTVAWMQRSADELKRLKTQAIVPGNGARQSILAVVDQTARKAGLGGTIKRVEPAGKGKVRIRMESVAFDDMITWLEGLTGPSAIAIESIAIDRGDIPGLVDAHLTLTDPTAQ